MPNYGSRLWAVDAERRMCWRGPGDESSATEPVPGDAAVLTCDPLPPALAVLDDGEGWRLDTGGWEPAWRTAGNLVFTTEAEARMAKQMSGKSGAPALRAAGIERNGIVRRIWAVSSERRLILLAETGRPETLAGGMPVPGDSRVLACDLTESGPTVVLDDGRLLFWSGAGWASFGSVLSSPGTVRCVVKNGLCLSAGRDVYPGDVIELPFGEARRLIQSGRVVVAADDSP